MFETYYEFIEAFPVLTAAIVFGFGACWGSFLNVVIYRVPKKMSLMHPGSHCFACGEAIKWYDNFPIVGWLMLRGRARCCGASFSGRYAFVELLTASLFVAVWVSNEVPVALVGFVFVGLMVSGAFIDFDTMELPDFCTVGGAATGLILSGLVPAVHGQTDPEVPYLIESVRSLSISATGMLVGSGFILWLAMFAEKLLGKEAMGFGDVLLMGCIGAFCGWEGALFSLFAGAFAGCIGIVGFSVVGRLTGKALTPGKIEQTNGESGTEEDSSVGIGTAIPFGPWLAVGALLWYLGLGDGFYNDLQTMIELLGQ